MTKIERALEADIDWRLAELAALRLAAAASNTDSIRHTASLRALWAMLYAHYEGFCKFALDSYLEYLESTGHVRTDLRTDLISFSLEELFKTLRGDISSEAIWTFVSTTLPSALSQKVAFSVKVDTKSNLWPATLGEACNSTGLLIPSLDSHTAKLRILVGRRNEIAHGKKNTIRSLDEYSLYETAVIDIIYELAYAISATVTTAGYLK